MSHLFLVGVLVVTRYIISGFWRNSARGIHGSAWDLQTARAVSVFAAAGWWAALAYSIWRYVP